jgi:hypothetical protein
MAGIALFGGIAGAIALVLALAAGTSWRRSTGLVLLGLSLALAWLLFAYSQATPEDEPRPNCSDCGVYLGRWWEPTFVLFILGTNLVAWTIGVLMGSALRAFRTHRRVELE